MANRDPATTLLLDRFVREVSSLLSPVAIWAHGSLGGGDYQPGRSDIDLIAVLDGNCSAEQSKALTALHRRLLEELPLAAKLHCSYLVQSEGADVRAEHLTWAHRELFHRTVTPVTRRELHVFGVVLHGPPPAGLLPPVTDDALTAFLIDEMRGPWREALANPELWRRDGWVDFGMLALARASVTLRSGRLITKAEALDVLVDEWNAPAEVVDDIRARRYADPTPATPEWIDRRARLTIAFLQDALADLPTPQGGVDATT
ncbi:nucleotidyltransferase domain-containing protein [Streptomyces sp. NPDC005963]|uniref:nucleotidyltransferase domain-containing protein n=1 Tax=Streptomyces sp. NPDC005963 TaxID=3156721 RepID=UPI0033E1EE4D